MENKHVISASLSTQSLTFIPGGSPVTFEVTVNNDSDSFANFQLEIIAAGEVRNSDYRWYRLEPEVAAAKPPGSTTKFQVFIFNTPIPGFIGTVNLSVKVLSPQLGRERRLLLRLEVGRDNKPILLSVELPIRIFQLYPGNSVDIPVRVRNHGQVASNALLRLTGIEPSWLNNSAERRLTINASSQTEVTFQCQLPSVVQALSQNYVLNAEVTSSNSNPANTQGNLEVLPVGFINFTTPQNKQRIPLGGWWVLDWKSNEALYDLLFKNSSNLRQDINIQVQGRDWRKFTGIKKSPEPADLNLGETAKVILGVKTKRPWVGIGKTLFFEARAEVSDQRLGSTDPATQSLELEVLPIIPLWLQLAILALIALLLAFILKPEAIAHTASVNSVNISGNSLSVVSASDDCTLRLWKIRNNAVAPEETVNFLGQPLACSQPHKPRGLLAIGEKAIRVVQFEPVQNKSVATGLDTGAIEIREVPGGKLLDTLQDPDGLGDQVFDIAFTTNSLNLFSGSGKGKLREWSRANPNTQFQAKPEVVELEKQQLLTQFQIRALALSPDDKIIVASGQFNRFLVLPVNSSQYNQFKGISLQKLENFKQLGGRGAPNDYIYGLAFLPNSKEKILATSDSAGYIAIWDLNEPCNPISNPQLKLNELSCKLIDSWQAKSTFAIRSLAFSEDRNLLISGGDDGKIIVWHLTPKYELDKTKLVDGDGDGETIYKSSKKINSIDLKNSPDKRIIVISGGEDSQVNFTQY
ncbi:WD-40 repeat-containing protein [Calothrix sp. NIES-4071]|nr:WD-40 repeat-containing protein [Calothrix sp. NIES-4071]BAZ62811.1 WD-40 repeat-containing protein [Calothrix sp. NIES-4105]